MKHFSKFLTETYHAGIEKNSEHPKDIKNSLTSFMRSGLVILSVILLASIAVAYAQKSIGNETVTSVWNSRISNKELPIYCVDTPEKKIALSFDAAWGKRLLLKSQI